MCARYELFSTAKAIFAGLGLGLPPTDEQAHKFRPHPTGEIRPTDMAPIITPRGLEMQPWGLGVEWQPQPLINARSETLHEKPAFRKLLNKRCLVPATGYFEWRKDGTNKLKNRITVSDADVFFFAGLTNGGRFTIITCPPASSIAHIHDRMPVIVPYEEHAMWLSPSRAFREAQSLLTTFSGKLAFDEEVLPPPRQGSFAF